MKVVQEFMIRTKLFSIETRCPLRPVFYVVGTKANFLKVLFIHQLMH